LLSATPQINIELIIPISNVISQLFERVDKPIRSKNTAKSLIFIDINIGSSDVTEADIKKVLEMAEEKYCPVWAMVKGNVKVETSYKVS
jgi:uncharacterized OsmC-like protein